MTTITSKRDVCHVWAQQERPRGKAGNVFFEGPVIYSYGHHFPIARFTKDRDGNECVLLTTQTYSPSTANHISQTRQAVSHKTIYLVMYVEAQDKASHKKNFDEMADDLKQMALEFPKKRTASTKQYLIDSMRSLVEQANSYSAAFRLGKKLVMSDNIAGMAEKISKAFKAEQKRNGVKLLKQQEEIKAKQKIHMEEWITGQHRYAGQDYDEPTKMRIVDREDGKIIETSRGARFPAAHAERAWKLIKACQIGKKEWHRNGSEIRVGEFHVDSIDADGTVTAGCHIIEFSEIERIAGLLGLS